MNLDEMGPESAKSFLGKQVVHAQPETQTGKPAERARQEIDYGRRAKGYIFGAFQPATGETLTLPYDRRTTVNWIDFLDQVEQWLPAKVERVYAILDNLSMHRATDVLLFCLAHPRCYEREQDIFDPLHYLPLLEKKPGAFDYAKPLSRWKKEWKPSYLRMLSHLREVWPDGRGVQEFVRILMLHERYPTETMEQAIERALSYGCVHLDGVLYCLHELATEEGIADTTPLDLSDRPDLDAIGNHPVDLARYEQLLKKAW